MSSCGRPGPRRAIDADFAALYRREYLYVRHTLRRFGAHYFDLPDLTQDVFAIAWRKRHDYDPERALRPWLFGIAFRVYAQYRRRRRCLPLPPELEAIDELPLPSQVLEQRERCQLIQEAVQSVNPKLRSVLIKHELDERPMAEIARELALPLKTAYSRLRLGREQLLRMLRRLAKQLFD